ncbi:metallophosphoesterase family protein [Selenihalanaerobacter shriftii]|uniref:DNA repair exonuclease SbcCD nuclease subunit n=1 Tax=Selenihalanaerobacter shriftii TaxID=142842 RepID=A0A1T4NE66_9FIRM|nr:DNA repair exonuclease [Selenihalanaerobacter shriftii]SJZ77433.1 DNA repair exonuclease SbcCD nuclease subunit [Selenihalanaerobacter shriftii]
MESVKILHTGDLHIGMRFNNYPDDIRPQLVKARFEVLENLVTLANEEEADLFVIAGDLFDKVNVAKRDQNQVLNILKKFSGSALLLLPGNHDYDDGVVDLWRFFEKELTDNLVLLNENKVFDLTDYGLDLSVYPAYCDSKHSEAGVNNLDWIKNLDSEKESKWQIGIAHGALEGYSPDLEKKYFNMNRSELEELNLDLWLLGHTHVPYPQTDKKSITGQSIFNAGTPEADGMDCRHAGNAFLLELDDKGEVKAQVIEPGTYKFAELEYKIFDEDDLLNVKEQILDKYTKTSLVRLKLKGRIDKDLFNRKEEVYKELQKNLAYFKRYDSELKINITPNVIDEEFSQNSFPHQFLKKLVIKEDDEEALQVAYELIKEVQ